MSVDPFLTLLISLKNKGIDLGSLSISEIRAKFYDSKYTLLSAIYTDWSGPDCHQLLRRLIKICPVAVADLGLIPMASVEERYPVIVNAPILTLFRSAKHLTGDEICVIYDLCITRQYHTSSRLSELVAVKMLCHIIRHHNLWYKSSVDLFENAVDQRLADVCYDCRIESIKYDVYRHEITMTSASKDVHLTIRESIIPSVVFDGCVTPAIWPFVAGDHVSESALVGYYAQYGNGMPPTFSKYAINEAIDYLLAVGGVKHALCSFISSPCLVERQRIIQLGQQLASSSTIEPDYYAVYKNLASQIVGDAALADFSGGIDNKFVISTCDNIFKSNN